MSLNYYDPSSRYKNRSRRRVMSYVVIAFYAFLFGTTGYYLRQIFHEESAKSQSAQLDKTVAENEDLQQQIMELKADLQFSVTSYEQLKRRFDEELPEEGKLRELLDLLRQQLDNGMEADRLSFLIRSSRPPSNCTDPVLKRLIVSTPKYKGEKSLAVADDVHGSDNGNVVKVWGAGKSARSEKGAREAWFDSSRSVTVYFENAEGKTEKREGLLPIRHSVVSGVREFRFSIETGSKGFAKVSYDVCDYP